MSTLDNDVDVSLTPDNDLTLSLTLDSDLVVNLTHDNDLAISSNMIIYLTVSLAPALAVC